MRRAVIVAAVLASVVVAANLYSELAPPRRHGVRIGAYYVRKWNTDVAHTAGTLQSAIADAVAKSGASPEGYPRAGVVHRVPTADRNVWQLECVPSSEESGKEACLRLRPTGEHVRLSWLEIGQTDARFHIFTVYVIDVWPWERIDPITSQRVVIDVEHPNNAETAASLLSLYDAVGEGLAAAGAREYRR